MSLESQPDPPPDTLTPTARPRSVWLWRLFSLTLCVAHTAAIWTCVGGFGGLSSPWPIPRHDHPVHFHSLSIAPRLFALSGTNAGYDPSFMAGYAKSVIFPQSSTLFDVVGLVTAGHAPAQAYKTTVFLSTAAVPWLVLAAVSLWRLSPATNGLTILLTMIYIWTDGGGAGFPLNYARYGMTAYLLTVPLGLVALALYTRFLHRPSFPSWLAAALAAALLWLVHITAAMIAVPAGLAAYVVSIKSARDHAAHRHVGTWAILPVVLILNAFWWWPGICLAGTMGTSVAAFNHSQEALWDRILKLLWYEPPIQLVILILFWPGLRFLARTNLPGAAAIGGYTAAGLFWGYLAGAFAALDILQPGRHAYAWHLGATIAAAAALAEVGIRLRPQPALIRASTILAIILLGARLFGYAAHQTALSRLGAPNHPSMLASDPPDRLRWVLRQIEAHMQPGQRLLYEESGEDLPGIPDPYLSGRFSGLLPHLAGIEVIGGPYLRAALNTNFTQFGENRLFDRDEWDLSYFLRHAEIYQPSAIVCWTPRSLAFVRAHPELFEIHAVDERNLAVVDPRTDQYVGYRSHLVFATLKGYGRPTSQGSARVRAVPGELAVSDARPAELDAPVVLRYHHVPRLRGEPSLTVDPVRLGDDPVPFIGLRPPPDSTTLRLRFAP